MPDCSYCEGSFATEDDYLAHLEAEHADELGPIDRRRIAQQEGDEGALGYGTVAWGLLLVGVLVVIVVAMLLRGGGPGPGAGAQQPTDLWSVHYHGTIDVVVEGETIDFSQSRYQMQADAFHFENGDGSTWHVHARDVTLEYAVGTLGIDVTESTVAFQGTTYRDSDPGTNVTVLVDGDPVAPDTYVLQEGDHIEIRVTQE